jgi:sterol 3beta-glucosyltransferase
MICPILYPIGDQQFWGQLAYKKGIAVPPIPLSKMTEKKFLAGIEELLTDQKLYTNATALKQLLDTEDGLQQAITEIEKSA